PLHRMPAVVLHVAHVVQEVGRARRRAVAGEYRERIEPAPAVAELRREDDPGEEEQVLRPLTRAQRNERGPNGAAAPGQIDDVDALRQRHAAILLAPGQNELEPAALA